MKTLDKHRSILEMNFIRKFPSFERLLRWLRLLWY